MSFFFFLLIDEHTAPPFTQYLTGHGQPHGVRPLMISYGSSTAHRHHYLLFFPWYVCNFRGGKGKLGTQSPPTTNQAGFSPNASPTPPSSGPTASSAPVKETVIHETDSKHMHDRMLFLLSNMIVRTASISSRWPSFQGYVISLNNSQAQKKRIPSKEASKGQNYSHAPIMLCTNTTTLFIRA